MLESLLNALGHAVVYAVLAGALLIAAYYVLDLVTPGHLGRSLRGVDETGAESVHAASRSAGLVTAAWLVSNAMVLFTAIWTNGATSLGWALVWTLSFGVLGIALNAAMFFVVELVTPGDLRRIVTAPGPARPLAYLAAAAAVSVGLIVCASIA
ncbi:DUF350 domain-containing protein [uncultured Nocardioides sp.]|uniref:DUF350 domain-containing protein n=1 Tax=uncultured Nocardioides sp. TaxID=198441 RepID=UPI0025D0B37F|nr:DUF350 domain-containing protein [uncultured Nocardioides sp.]